MEGDFHLIVDGLNLSARAGAEDRDLQPDGAGYFLHLPQSVLGIRGIGRSFERNMAIEATLPIRFLPTPPRCRVLPGTGVKLCIGRCGNAACDAEQ
jgi:hypothetical protein